MPGKSSLLATLLLPFASTADNGAIYLERLGPLLAAHCSGCHGAASASGGLNVQSLDKILEGGKRGAAILPGNSGASLMMKFVRGEQQPKMPLGGSLDAKVVEAFASAIDAMKPEVKAHVPQTEWAYRKPVRAGVPAVRNSGWVRNPIDAFVLARLEGKGMTPAREASRRSLIRRVYFDLIGLPPTPEQVREFEADESPGAVERVVDRLLEDQRYGERWARHWLDLVRYAESDGFAIDGERPTAWRYRDYVIRSFQSDKPYDQFVKEQIAGDEADDKRINREEGIIALGFLRMATWEADANFKTQLRQDFLNEATGTTSQVFLGLTAGCARCHDHKYDPIPQRDFYRLQAFFAATRVDDRANGFLEIENPKKMRASMRKYEDETDAADQELKAVEKRLKEKFTGKGDFMRALRDKKDPSFTEAERREHEAARNRHRRVSEAIARHRPFAYAVSDVVPPHVPSLPDTFVLKGGELSAKGEKVEPGFLSCLTGSSEPAAIPFAGGSSGRRRALAEWLANPSNPLTARVMVNRIWQHHFGEGIVRTPSDFGRNGDRASHPELLDWLASEFVAQGWSVKKMHKLMLTSSTYRLSTEHPDWKKYAEADPNNLLLWRMNWIRLESEALRDTLLALSGDLQPSPGGPGAFFTIGQDVADGFEFFKWFASDEEEQHRRTIYMFQRRSVTMPMMEMFDGANMSESCARRNTTTVAPQAFTLLNGEMTVRAAQRLAERIVETVGPSAERQIARAFELTLGRTPSAEEAARAATLYSQSKPRDALARLNRILFNVNEFLYLE
jgi:cytochrome c553